MDSLPRGVPVVQFHNRIPFGTYDIEICQSYMTELPSRGVLSKSYDNFMPAAYLRVQIRNSMPSRKKSLWKNFSHHGWPPMKILVFWIVIRSQKCFERRFTLSALLIVFIALFDCWLLFSSLHFPLHFLNNYSKMNF